MDISGPEVESVAMQLLPKSVKDRLIVPEPTVTCSSSLPEVNVKQLKSLHNVFSEKTKEVVVNALKHCTSDDELSAVLNAVKKRNEALQGVTIRNVKNWIRSRVSKATANRGNKNSESSGCGPVLTDVQKSKKLGLISDEQHIVLDEDELIKVENNDFHEISEDEEEEEEEGNEDEDF